MTSPPCPKSTPKPIQRCLCPVLEVLHANAQSNEGHPPQTPVKKSTISPLPAAPCIKTKDGHKNHRAPPVALNPARPQDRKRHKGTARQVRRGAIRRRLRGRRANDDHMSNPWAQQDHQTCRRPRPTRIARARSRCRRDVHMLGCAKMFLPENKRKHLTRSY